MNEENVFYEGNINNPAVIFVHAFPLDHNMWHKQVDALKKDFYCVTLDIRGLGGASAGDGQFTMEDLADDVITLVKNNNLKKPVLCGLSLGGYISQRVFQKAEDLFGALVLCDTKAQADGNEAKLKRANGIRMINEEGIAAYVEDFIPNCFGDKFKSENNEAYRQYIERSKSFDPKGLKGCQIAMLGRLDYTDWLSEIKKPVLILCGEHDKLSPPDLMKTMAERIKNCEFHVIPDSGHMSAIENPAKFNYLLKAFLHKVTIKA
jgi:3-oxoadipate enol-lactonase